MKILFFKKDNHASLIKSTVLKEITVPAYTRTDGTFVPEYRRHVHVNPDISHADIAAGRGSSSQRRAYRQLSRRPGFNELPKEHRVAHIQSAATDIQQRGTQSGLLSNWRASVLARRNPTPSQWQAFYQLDNAARTRELDTLSATLGDISFLSAPAREVAPEEAAQLYDVSAEAATQDGVVADPIINTYPGDTNTQIEVIKNTVPDTYSVGVRDLDSGHLASPLRRWSGPDALDQATAYAESLAAQQYDARSTQAVPAEVEASVDEVPDSSDYFNLLPREIEINGSFLTRRDDGSWITRTGVLYSEGSAMWTVANVQSGIGLSANQVAALTDDAKIRALNAMIEFGNQAELMLNLLFPPSNIAMPGAREGDKKTVFDKTYIVRRGGWHLQDNPAAEENSAPSVDSAPKPYEFEINGYFLRRNGKGSWIARSGQEFHAGSSLWLIANVISGVGLRPDQVSAASEEAKDSAFHYLLGTGRNPAVLLNVFYPESINDEQGPQAGDTKTINGSTYILRNGRWHLQFDIENESNLFQRDVSPFVYRRVGPNVWQVNRDNTGRTNWEDVVDPEIVASLDQKYSERVRQTQTVTANPPILITRPVSPELPSAPRMGNPITAPESQAIRAAMVAVPIPDEVAHWSDSATNRTCRNRIRELNNCATFGDLDGVTNIVTNTNRSNYAVVDRYRAALLAAAHAARESVYGARFLSRPVKPVLHGANMQNHALIAAQNKCNALERASLSDDPISAISAIHTGRGNTYLNKTDDYKVALLRWHESALTPVVSEAAAVFVAPVSVVRAKKLPVSQDPIYAANQQGLTEQELHFVPRPNVPLTWSVSRQGVTPRTSRLYPWPDEKMKNLARRYLMQPSNQQKNARRLQRYFVGFVSPQHPGLKKIEALVAKQEAANQAQALRDRQAREVAEAEQRRSEMELFRTATVAVAEKLAALDPIHTPTSRVGSNIPKFETTDFTAASRFFGVQPDMAKELIGRMVANMGDFGLRQAAIKAAMKTGDPVQITAAKKKHYPDKKFSDFVVTGDARSLHVTFGSSQNLPLIERTFFKDGNHFRVHHDYFRMPVDLQGGGNAKHLFQGSIGVYKALGVNHSDVLAALDKGGYVWAKLAYKIRQSDWDRMRSELPRYIERLNVPESTKDKLKAVCGQSDPLSFFLIADAAYNGINLGFKLLAGRSWSGDFRLSDPFLLERCMNYLRQPEF